MDINEICDYQVVLQQNDETAEKSIEEIEKD